MSRQIRSLRFLLLVAITILAAGLLTLPSVAQAQIQDEVGIYWDPAYTSNLGTTPTIPGAITGYLVLHNPSGTGGVLGWEACIDLEGPGSFAGWDFQGQAINAGTEPCFAVGYTTPLPAGNDIILASFTAVAVDVGPIMVTMAPYWFSSLPGELSYIPGDDPEALIAMRTVTGLEAVAGLNGANPGIIVGRDVIDFGGVAMGDSKSEFLTITNQSDQPLPLDLSITDLCDFFTLPAGTGLFTVPANGSLDIEVVFSPVQEHQVNCTLYLGENLSPVSLTGNGIAPIISWNLTGDYPFSNTTVGQQQTRRMTLYNTGNTTFEVDLSLPAECGDFQIVNGGGFHVLNPNSQLAIDMAFTPQSAGPLSCLLSFGNSPVGDYLLEGTGVAPVTSWNAPTSFDFLTRFVGELASSTITITNTGGTIIPLTATLPGTCVEFGINQGGGTEVNLQPGQSHHVAVQFQTTLPGQYQCFLDLGDVIPAIQLDGQSVPGLGSVTVTPSELGFAATLTGQSTEMDLFVTNIVSYDVPLDIAVREPAGAFSLVSGGGVPVLTSGMTHTIRVRFNPMTAEFHENVLYLGGNQSVVPLSGSGYAGTPDCLLEPSALNFGDVLLGTNATLDFTITNTGDVSMLIEPSSSVADFTVTDLPSQLAPGQQRTLTVNYHAAATGPLTGFILLGDTACGAVTVTANGILDPNWVTVDPDSINIPPVALGVSVERQILVSNAGPAPLDLNVMILAPTSGFELFQGGGQGVLYPGDSHVIVLQFLCLQEGTYTTALALGPGLPVVPIHAVGFEIKPDCELETGNLNFGEVAVGGARIRYVDITNNSDSEMVLGPLSSSPAFEVSDAPIVLAPEATASLQVTFRPTGTTGYSGSISLANGQCADIGCFGVGVSAENFTEDVLGIYWDSDYNWIEIVNPAPNSLFTGYLVMSNPSATGGILGWECQVEVLGPAIMLGWQLQGDNINIGSGSDFVVGLASPLPFTDQTLLGTFEVIATDPEEYVLFNVLPTHLPSVVDQMSWIPGSDPDALLPMHTRWGQPLVATIGPPSPLAVETPSPQVQLLGQQVNLRWPAPTGINEGCHVYRRPEGQASERLTSVPLSSTGPTLSYTDVATGLAPGSRVHYSYAVVRDGEELARSPEVEIVLPALPDLTTRLLPNVPNPFNPMTEIRFELGAPQQVSLKIYDVTGRLVRDLESGSLDRGPHSRVWQGRDSSGRQVPSGAYYVRLVTDSKVENQKILLLK